MSAEAVAHVYRHSDIPGATGAGAVLAAIADTVSDVHGYQFWMAVDELAGKARVSPRRTSDALATLRQRGWIQEVRPATNKDPAVYQFVLDRSRPVVWEPKRLREAAEPGGDAPSPQAADGVPSPSSTGETPRHPKPRQRGRNVRSRGDEASGPGVTQRHPNPRGTQEEPKTSPSTPSEPGRFTVAEEEDLLVELYRALPGRIADIDRLRHDPALHDLVGALADLEAAGWDRRQIAGALVADPLDDARSLARVLTARARHLANQDPPSQPHHADPDCPDCHGRGFVHVAQPDGVARQWCPCGQEVA